MLILNFTYPLRCLRIPPVEYHCSRMLRFKYPPPTGTALKCSSYLYFPGNQQIWDSRHRGLPLVGTITYNKNSAFTKEETRPKIKIYLLVTIFFFFVANE
jgi:hypothetical protein